MAKINILAIGDVVDQGGCEYLSHSRLRRFAERMNASLVVVNGENSARGNGISPKSADSIFEAGADVITGGNHTFRRHEFYSYMESNKMALRPANYPGQAPGNGWVIADCMGWRVLCINLMGNVFMDNQLDSPFVCADRILSSLEGKYDAAVVDIHAEATSEKLCLARYLDGRVSAVWGTHTHLQTADACVLPGGTGYITDLGMTGSKNGVLGVRTECIVHKFIEKTPVSFQPAEGGFSAEGALFCIDTATGKCVEASAVVF